jgi:hypothetical protein
VKTGIIFTVRGILNLCEKNEKIKSMASCVTKFISTNKPSNEYEIPYREWNVRNKTGERFDTIDIEIFDV